MALSRLSIENFRNIASAELVFSPGCNLVTGANAAGKTSILEAIHFLGRARSFRTHRNEQLIREGAAAFQLVAHLDRDGRQIPVGLRRGRKDMEIRMGGEKVQRVSQLATQFPLVVMASDLHKVLEEGPKYRRQFVDWGLFHVEQKFHGCWRQFSQALKQRNAILRSGGSTAQIRAWDPALLTSGNTLHALRVDYIEQLKPLFVRHAEEILGMKGWGYRYSPGWAQRHQDFTAALGEGLATDREQGFTRAGPHRADLQFIYKDQDIRDRLSRGQQKQLVTALLLSQAELLRRSRDQVCQFLIDDLPAELDREHQLRVLSQLQSIGAQVFITAITEQSLDLSGFNEQRMFHVEHGKVREVV